MRLVTTWLLVTAFAIVAQACETDTPIASEDSGVSDGGGRRSDGGALDAGGACPDLATGEGMPCAVDGQFCGECSGGPCSFCNQLHCESGVWVHLETFPACEEDGGVEDGGAEDAGPLDAGALDAGSGCALFGESCSGRMCCAILARPLVCDPDSATCHDEMGGALGNGELCDPGESRCGTGLSCCYPCGVGGCDYQCAPTCDDGDPGCSGGCFLFP